MLIYAITGRRVPAGGLPSDVGCVVMNVSTASVLSYYMETGEPLIKKRLTVAGSAVNEPKNVFAPIGASISDVVAFCGGYNGEPTKIIMGGPMMGIAQYDDSMPILKQNNAILALSEKDAHRPREDACIRCGRCHSSCPMSLTPTRIEILANAGNGEELKKLGVSSCMECGSCAFACPAGRPLVQYMKYAKTVERKAVTK